MITAAEIAAMLAGVDFTIIKGELITLFTGMSGVAATVFVGRKILSQIR